MSEQTVTTDPFEVARQGAVGVLRQLIAEANESAKVVKAAQNQNAVIADVIESSDDDQVVKFRDFMEQLEAKRTEAENAITEYVKANLLPKGEENDLEGATANYKEKKAAIKSFVDALKVLPGGEDAVKDLPELQSLGRGGGNVGGTGTKRPRVEEIYVRLHDSADWKRVYATQKDPKNEGATREVTNFTVAAQKLKGEPFGVEVSAKELRELAEAEAGDSSEWSNREGKPFEFAVTRGDDENRKHVLVKVVPQNG